MRHRRSARPERLGLKILMALLDILDCDMTDLIEPVPAAGQDKKARAAGGDAGTDCTMLPVNSTGPVGTPLGEPPAGSRETA